MPLGHLQKPFRDSSSSDARWQSVRQITIGAGTYPFYRKENGVIDSHTPRSGRGSPWLPVQGCLRAWCSFHSILPLAYYSVILYKNLRVKRNFSLAREPNDLLIRTGFRSEQIWLKVKIQLKHLNDFFKLTSQILDFLIYKYRNKTTQLTGCWKIKWSEYLDQSLPQNRYNECCIPSSKKSEVSAMNEL